MTKNFYIDNKQFYEEFVKWSEKDYEDPIPENIMLCLYRLVNEIAKTKNFVNYSNLWLDEMKGEAFMKCCEKVRYFNVEKSTNPFSYFTTIVRNSFIMYIKKNKQEKIYSTEYIYNLIETKQINNLN